MRELPLVQKSFLAPLLKSFSKTYNRPTMPSLYTRFLTRGLNLDRTARVSRESRIVSLNINYELSSRRLWELIRLLFLQVLNDRACAIHFCRERDGSFRMLYCFAQLGDTWYEMVPPPGLLGSQIINALRQRAGLGCRHEGTIHYLLGGLQTATCISPDPQALCIYFSSHRPRLLDENAGDIPGEPTSNTTEIPPDLPTIPAGLKQQLLSDQM